MNCQAKYYKNNKDKVLSYKKEFYRKKVEKYEPFKNIQINSFSKSQSNKLIRFSIDNNLLLLCYDSKLISIEEFSKNYHFPFKTIVKSFIMIEGQQTQIEEIDYEYCLEHLRSTCNEEDEDCKYFLCLEFLTNYKKY